MSNPGYFDTYKNLAMSRDDDGVLTVRFHTGGGPIVFTGQTHEDLPRALEDIAIDADSRWVCPLAPDGNTIGIPIPAGERLAPP